MLATLAERVPLGFRRKVRSINLHYVINFLVLERRQPQRNGTSPAEALSSPKSLG